jgi:hypothetical protein
MEPVEINKAIGELRYLSECFRVTKYDMWIHSLKKTFAEFILEKNYPDINCFLFNTTDLPNVSSTITIP